MRRVNLILPLTIFFIVGCGNNSNDNTKKNPPEIITPTNPDVNIPDIDIPTPPENIIPTCLSGEALVKGKVVDISNKGLSNISIELNGCQTKSNSKGLYSINNTKASEKGIVKITSNNYAKTYIPIEVKEKLIDTNETSNNYLITVLSKYNNSYMYSSSEEFEKPVIFITKNNYFYRDGLQYHGTVSTKVMSRQINTKESRRNFPGEFKGINSNGVIVNFESLGLIEVSIKDDSERTLHVKEPMNIVFFSINSNEDTLPLWKYNEEALVWEESGIAYKREIGGYEADISDIGIWAINKPFKKETGTYVGRITDIDGDPVKNVRVYLTSNNWISSQLSSDENGIFEISVKADEKFSIYAFTFKDNYLAEYKGDLLGPVGSGEVLDDRT